MNFFDHLKDAFHLPLQNPVLVFSLILFIILLAPIIFRKLKAPGIVGLILCGVAVGPHGLNLLENNEAIQLFSTIGILYLMFLAGLELDLNEFLKARHRSIIFGVLTFAIPMIAGFIACYWGLGYGALASLLTSSMFATHTLVAYPIVTRYGLSREASVAIAVGGTIITDTAVLILLAGIVGSYQSGISWEFFLQLLITFTLFSLIMFLVVPYVAKWVFSRLESEKTSHYIFVLSVVFFAAFLAAVAGLEPIIGAFMAGLALNRLIPHSSALMNRLDFVGNAIFIPFFLISVGMLVDLSVLTNGIGAWIVAGVLTVVALTGKWLAALVTQYALKMTSTQRQLIFGLSSAHAAATLAVITIGHKLGIVDDNILNGTIVLILITCLVASMVTDKAVKKIVISENTAPNVVINNGLPAESILIPVANFSNIETLLDFTTLIKDRKSHHPVNLVSVVQNDNMAEINLVKVRRKLEQWVRYASAADVQIKSHTTIDTNVAHGIIRIAREISASTLVMGWPGKETFLDRVFGHKTDNIVEITNKNIIVCKIKRPLQTYNRIRVVCPPMVETVKGFPYWVKKVTQIATELKLPIDCYATKQTMNAIQVFQKHNRNKPLVKHLEIDDWEEFRNVTSRVYEDELLIVISARQGIAGYQNEIDLIHKKLTPDWESHSIILFYPLIEVEDLAEASV
jgi:Kef-type K+ transport system membrane component KefB